MIKTLVFDLDGVLCKTKAIHYEALNRAIKNVAGEKYVISLEDHIHIYDGLPTRTKLKMLSERQNLPKDLHQKIWEAKQSITHDCFRESIQKNRRLIDTFTLLKSSGFKIYIATNSIRDTTSLVIAKLGLLSLINGFYSNEDVVHAKPHPEIYLRCMVSSECGPSEMLIFEDSPAGLQAAIQSGAHVFTVKNLSDVNYSSIMEHISNLDKRKIQIPWQDETLNVVIPCAGAGKRFAQAGYKFPKPIIDVNGRPMIEWVLESLNIKANYIYLFQREHLEEYNIRSLLNILTPGCTIVPVDGITEGGACTVLLAEEYINNDNPILLVNSDQYVEWDSSDFMYKMINRDVDVGILTFPNHSVKWSYAKTDDYGYVTQIAEKNPISEHATIGIYYAKKGSDFVRYAKQMINKDRRVNGEFYVCPVFQEYIEDDKKVLIHELEASQMHGMGTPEDLNNFLIYLNKNA